jgi:acetyl esterase/lipase
MKSTIFIKVLLLSLLVSFCSAGNIIDELKERKRDIENYLKVKDIKREIKFNSKKRTLDVYYKKDEIQDLKPVVIFFYGGTWYRGDRIKFTKFGSLLEENDYIGVIPNYILFPFGDMEDMVNDIYTSIKWTYENIEKYGGDPHRITVAGHSAGAHLISLSLLKAYNYMENDDKTLQPLPEIEKLVLLHGPFDFDDYSLIKNSLPEEDADDTFVEQLVKVLLRTKDVSPYDIIKSMDDNSVDDSFNVKKFIFYYTGGDNDVPERSAKKFMKQLNRVCGKNVEIQYVFNEKDYAHNAITVGIRSGDEEHANIFLSLLKL